MIKKRLWGLLLVLFIGLVSMSAWGASLKKGPYLQNAGKTSITICWVTEEEGKGEVRYGKTKKLKEKIKEKKETKYHQVSLKKLTPSTEYFYQVVGKDYSSSVETFQTAPNNDEPFSFVVFGDTRSGHLIHQGIIQKIILKKPNLVINTGDLVGDGRKMEDWDTFFNLSQPLMKRTPYYPMLGNHEHNSSIYFDLFSLPGNERYYSFDYGNSHFVVLDSNAPFLESKEQHNWLREDLSSHQDATFTFVFFHHPAYSTKEGREWERKMVRLNFCPILEEFKVALVFNGHDHTYHHYLVGGIHYLITAGGGASLYKIGPPEEGLIKAESTHHFTLVSIKGKNLKIEAFYPNGSLLDSFTLVKPSTGL